MEKLWRHAEIVSAADAEEGEMYLQDNTKIDCIHMELKVKWQKQQLRHVDVMPLFYLFV